MADTAVWKLLDLNVLEGTPRRYTEGQRNIVITESFRKKYFKNENPVGKIVYDVPTYQTQVTPYLITGVIKDIPSNSVFSTDAIILYPPWEEALSPEGYGTFTQGYVLFKSGTDIQHFTKKFNDWYARFVEGKNQYQYAFQPLKDIYLHSGFEKSTPNRGDFKTIYILTGIALLLLLIACVNFVNLSTARAFYRLKESGVRKILGAGRKDLISQYLTESLLFFLIAGSLSVILYVLVLPVVAQFIGHPLGKNILASPTLLPITAGVVLLLSLLTGLYPAWILSGFKPSAALKGKLFTGRVTTQTFVRKSLVVVQFGISIFVLIALIVMQYQLSFMKNKDIGFNKENLLNISFINWNNKGETFKNELKKTSGVVRASITSWTPGQGPGYMSREIDNPNKNGETTKIWYINGDADFAQTMGLNLQQGRLLDPALQTDAVPPDAAQVNMQNRSALLTHFTASFLNVEELNKPLKGVVVTPVGIVGNFNSESLRNPMQPTIITAEDSLNYGNMLVRIQPGAEKSAIAGIQKLWRKFYPNNLLEIQWMDDIINEQYKAESRLSNIFTFFSSLTMLLAALGIFGLIVQATAQRVKEIGIRKVLGASANSIVRLFSLDFMKLILIALLIASPIAGWLMNKWLMDYAYRITIQWWMFGIAGLTALIIALLTISFQAIKAAMANPVESLRTE